MRSMASVSRLAALLLAVCSNFVPVSAQNSAPNVITDSKTGIKFDSWTIPNTASGAAGVSTWGGMTLGMVMPSNALTTDATEFIGYLQCASNSTVNTGWCGISLGGPMTNSLLLMAWPWSNQIYTSFLWATGYETPVPYTGNAQLTQISSTVNSTHYTLIFRCQNCLAWNQNGATGKNPAGSSTKQLILGWSQAFPPPINPSCPAQVSMVQHDNGQGIWGANLDSNAAAASYSAWAALATKTVTGCGGASATSTATTAKTTAASTATTVKTTGTKSATSAPSSAATTSAAASATATGKPVPTNTYDYIIVGAGAGGIPIADKLSEAGKSVLLIEKGPPSSGRWGGNVKPDWLGGTNLTRFDVPGLCNEIWVDSAGIACTDTDQMAGCVLGGGTAINAGLWWKPNAVDWDYNFPSGWKSSDMANAASRVFSRIPGTYFPSSDGQLYLPQGYNMLSAGLKSSGWAEVQANSSPDQKNRTFTHTPYMFSHGERGGPMATYLVTANARSNFKMWTNTAVKRVVRSGGHITGVEVEPFGAGGYQGVVNVTPVTGRVILSAGTFGSAKLLMRSGIGPTDQLQVVNGSRDGPTMISSDYWINLPVGYNLEDHTNTDTVLTQPDVVFYDFYQAFDNPNVTDKNAYLNKRAGILTQAAPNIGPIFFDQIVGADGITRQLQWTARVEGSDGVANGKAMTLSQYLGRGATSRGRMTITNDLNTVVSTLPYLHDKNDVAAVIQGIKNVQAALSGVKNLTWVYPPAGQSVEDFVNNMVVSYSNRRANHWIGTNKLGGDDGRNGGTAVVDLNAKVWGTDNLFVVDAGLFPGHVTTNPSAYIVTLSERASERILALAPAAAGAQYAQCDGLSWTGSFQCKAPYKCTRKDQYYSQCL